MNVNPVFSVIIPTFNRDKTIKRAVESVLSQTFQDFELIIVDDGSKDRTHEIIQKYSDDRIIYIKYEVNKGQNYALNTGVSKSKGFYLSFLDSDDEWSPEMLEKVYEKFQSDKETGCVYSRAVYVDSKGNRTSKAPDFNLEGFIYKEALAQGYISSMIALSVKKECFMKIGGFDVDFVVCQDDEICLKLAKYYKFGLIKEDLALAHCDGNERLTTNLKKNAEGWWKLINKFEKEIVDNCGKSALSKHYFNCAEKFLIAGNRKMALTSIDRAGRLSKLFDIKAVRLMLLLPGTFFALITLKLFKRSRNVFRKSKLSAWIKESPSTRSPALILYSIKKYGAFKAVRALFTGRYYNEDFYEEHIKIKDGYRYFADFIHKKYRDARSVIDFGCGNAYLITFLKKKGITVKGIDFSKDNSKYIDDGVKDDVFIADITGRVDFKPADLVISTEVAEHIPKKFSEAFISNLVRHSKKYVIFSASQPGQWGDGHINCQKKEYWIGLFEKEGAIYEKIMTENFIYEIKNIETIASSLGWFGNLMFFSITNGDKDDNKDSRQK